MKYLITFVLFVACSQQAIQAQPSVRFTRYRDSAEIGKITAVEEIAFYGSSTCQVPDPKAITVTLVSGDVNQFTVDIPSSQRVVINSHPLSKGMKQVGIHLHAYAFDFQQLKRCWEYDTSFSVSIEATGIEPIPYPAPLKVTLTKDTFYYGDYDTIAFAELIPSDSCKWIDSTFFTFSCGAGHVTKIDSTHFIAAGTIDWHRGRNAYVNAQADLGCGYVSYYSDHLVIALDRASVLPTTEFDLSLLGGRNVVLQSRRELNETVEVTLYDLLGRILYVDRRKTSGDIAALAPPGCYWYTLRAGGWSKSGKVMTLP